MRDPAHMTIGLQPGRDGRVLSIELFDRLGVTPYYKNQWCAVLLGDCREIMAGIPDETFDLLLTDPPYGVEFVSNMRQESWGAIAGDDGSLDVIKCLESGVNKLHHGSHLYVFGPFDLSKLKVTVPVEIIWNKCSIGMGNLDCVWSKNHEPIQFAVNAVRQGKATKDCGKLTARKRRGTVLSVERPNPGTNSHHPTEKPVELLRQLIESSTVMRESVLDPFAGSGSTLVAAQIESRYAVGIEYEERHCETIAKRLEQLGAW